MRKGQNIFNFLEWLRVEKGYSPEQGFRMADPFYIDDSDYDKLWNEFNKVSVEKPLSNKSNIM